MLKDSRKSQPNQQFYLKKLHTETFSSPSMKDQFLKLTDKMENQIQMVKKRLRVKNLKMFRAQQKLKTIQKQQANMRETLRNNIDNKLKQSQSKLENMMMTKNSQSNSKDKLRQTTLSRIKSMEKTFVEQSFRKSQDLRQESETFFFKKGLQKYSRTSSFAPTPSRSRYVQNEEKGNESLASTSSRKKILPRVLKVTEKEIKEKQTRKSHLEESKDTKNLYQYIQKLNNIDAKRQNRSNRLTETVKMIEKQRKKEQQRYESKKKAQSLLQKDKMQNKSYASAMKTAIKNKYSFSQLYAKKLEEKLQRKLYFEQQSFQSGNSVMKKQGQVRQRKRQNRLVNQAVRQVQRKVNFKYMEHFRK